jgi:hypothetical protein
MRAHRLRHQTVVDLDAVTTALRRRSRLSASCAYECPSCQERYLGERRCPECNLWNRNLGLGGTCSGCDQVVVLAELIPELEPGPRTTRNVAGPRSPAAATGVRT